MNSPNGKYADAVAFSFENKKHLTTGGEGGMISTSNSEIATKARKFAGLGYLHLSADAGRTSLASSVFQRPDYERYDTISLNYRMSPLAAAVGLGQLQHFESMLKLRQNNAKTLLELICSHQDFTAQEVPTNSTHAYYTTAVKYTGLRTWRDIYNQVNVNGGDGFYGCVLNPYLEPVFRGNKTLNQSWERGLCPVAENIQPQVMAIKSDFRDARDLARNRIAWEKTLSSLI